MRTGPVLPLHFFPQAKAAGDPRLPAFGELLPTMRETGGLEHRAAGDHAALAAGLKAYLITADHSPEAPTEFERIRRQRACSQPGQSHKPELLMVRGKEREAATGADPSSERARGGGGGGLFSFSLFLAHEIDPLSPQPRRQ